ncbi:hypothetical protein ABPG72_003910 [Tetrahymena utriculariae]
MNSVQEQSSCCLPSNNECTFFSTPLEAYQKSQPEKILYTVMLPSDPTKPDYLATIDVDPTSERYSKIIHRLDMPRVGDELHHFGWNACVSCKGNAQNRHRYLVLPSMKSANTYIVDVLSDPLNPTIKTEITGEELARKTNGGSFPHTTHCLPSGEIMISLMGQNGEEGGGGFALIDGHTFEVKNRWESQEDAQNFGYDFWYQPNHNIMVSSQFGSPKAFWYGFNPEQVQKLYGNSLLFWDWQKRKLINKVELGSDGLIPLEVRFPHNPQVNYGFVGAALSSTLIKFQPNQQTGLYEAKKVAEIAPINVKGWALPTMPGLITDILISLDDRFLYASCWLHGCVNQYDITDPDHPKLASTIYLGGSLVKGGSVIIIDEHGKEREDLLNEVPVVKGKRIQGGPQMLQLSRDGKRLYVTSSLLRPWDSQFYPEMVKNGGQILKVDVDTVDGGMKLDTNFIVDLSNEPHGPSVAHEVRYPGGDCSSDIWV